MAVRRLGCELGPAMLFLGRRKGDRNAMTPQFFSILVLSFVFGAALPLAPVWAGDVNRCIDECFGTYSEGDLRDLCLQRCRKPTISYGAIAYGAQSTANGYAFG